MKFKKSNLTYNQFLQLIHCMIEDKQQKTSQQTKLSEKRFELVSNIRRQKRTGDIAKRRNKNLQFLSFADKILYNQSFPSLSETNLLQQLLKLKAMTESNSDQNIRLAILRLRKILCQFQPSPIQLVIDTNLIPKVFSLAHQNQNLPLKIDACWVIANITSGTHQHCRYLVNGGVISLLKQCFNSESPIVFEQAIWALSNIASDGHEMREILFQQQILNKIIPLFKLNNIILSKLLIWCCYSLLKKPRTLEEEIWKPLLEALYNLLKNPEILQDSQSLSSLLWIINSVIEKSKKAKKQVLKFDLVPDLLLILSNQQQQSVEIAALRIIGSLAASQDGLSSDLIDSGVLPVLESILDDPSTNVVKEACWILSNLCAEGSSEVQIIFKNQKLMQKLLDFSLSKSTSIQKEIGWIFCNIADVGDKQLIFNFYKDRRIMAQFLNLLSHSEDNKALEVGVTGIQRTLMLGDQFRQDGVNLIQQQFRHQIVISVQNVETQSQNVQRLCLKILQHIENAQIGVNNK